MNVSEQQWRVPRKIVNLKIVVALAFIGLAWWFSADTERLVVAVVIAVIVAGYAVRDLLFPVRLAAGPDGVMVSRGLVFHREIAWDDIKRLRIDRRRRVGSITELLEIDVDTTLYLFSKHELDSPLEDVLAALRDRRYGPR